MSSLGLRSVFGHKASSPDSAAAKFKLFEMNYWTGTWIGLIEKIDLHNGVPKTTNISIAVPAEGSFYHLGRVQEMQITNVWQAGFGGGIVGGPYGN